MARIAVPVAVAGAVAAGVVAAASPGQTSVAYPAPVSSVALAPSASPAFDRHDRGSRAALGVRPVVSPSASLTASTSPKPTASAKPKPKPSTKPKPKPPVKLKPAAKVARPVVLAPALKVVDTKYATVALNVRTAAADQAKVVTVAQAGSKLSVTSAVRNGFRFISYRGQGRWVKDRYLSDKKPHLSTKKANTARGGISDAACKSGSSMESGLTPDAVKVHRALCARYPQITSFGGRRGGGGFHGTGQAVDNMVSDSKVGWQIANWVRAHAKDLGVSEVIYSQRIWTVQRSSEGWRSMSDRGSRTANHYDHVHVSVYGNRATS